jgi:hypothetical protein
MNGKMDREIKGDAVTIILTKEELTKLLELTNAAKNTPVIYVGVDVGPGSNSWADDAWDAVREYWRELGKKYNFDPESVRGISSKTGEVHLS